VIRERKFRVPCLEAYGLSPDASDERALAVVAPHDPLPRLRGLPAEAPLPQVLILHGDQDENIPPETNAVPLHEALKRAGAPVELVLYPGVGHAVYQVGEPVRQRLKTFFANTL